MSGTTLKQRLRHEAVEIDAFGFNDGTTDLIRKAADRIEADASTIASLRDANKALTAKVQELENDLRIGMANFDAAEAKLAKVEHKAEKYDSVVKALSVCDGGRYRNDTIESCVLALSDRDRLSAELAEARADYLNASRDASNLAGKLNAAEAVIERALESLCGDYPSMAADFRSFLASKEASQ